MHGNSESVAVAGFLLAPSGLLGDSLQDSPGARGIQRIQVRSASAAAAQLDDAILAENFEQVFHAIASRHGGQLIDKRMNRESVRDIGDRTQPSDADMRFGRAV